MPAVNDLNFITVMQYGKHVTASHGWLCERSDRIKARQRARSRADARGLRCDLPADESKNFSLEVQNAFFGAENFAFPLFQGRCGESFGVGQRLSSFVIGGHARSVCLGDLDEIPKHIVIANTQRADTAAGALFCFQARNRLPRVTAE